MNNKYCILIIEDDEKICKFITTVLASNNYSVVTAKDGREALSHIPSYCPDLILLDLGLPDMDGSEIIRSVREWSLIPIIVISARDRGHDKVEALDLGADDYMTKPFDPAELLARIRTALRHNRNLLDTEQITKNVFQAKGLTIDFERRRVSVGEKEVHFTQNEYKIVALLSKYAGRVLTHDYIIKNIWGPNSKNDNQILRVNMANIRRKIEENPAEPTYIFTEVGVGYRMIEPD